MTTKNAKKAPLVNIKIVGEGFDEFGQRYLKLKVNGSTRSLPPYSMADILDPKRLYRELGDAGCKLFSRQLQNRLQAMLQSYEQLGAPSFSIVTRLRSFRAFYVRPHKIIRNPARPVTLP